MDLETAVQQQTADTPPDEVTELVLDACKATKVVLPSTPATHLCCQAAHGKHTSSVHHFFDGAFGR